MTRTQRNALPRMALHGRRRRPLEDRLAMRFPALATRITVWFTQASLSLPRGSRLRQRLVTLATWRAFNALSRGDVDGTAYIEATVRSAERALGAKIDDRPDFFARRAREARNYARLASETLLELSEASRGLADEFDRASSEANLPDDIPLELRWRGNTLDSLMPDQVLATVYRVGIPITAIQIPLRDVPWRQNAADSLSAALRDAGERSAGLGGVLAKWEPHWGAE